MPGPAATQYLLPDGMRLAGAGDVLAAHLVVQNGSVRAADRTFYDTFDARLRDAGAALVHADGRLALLDPGSFAERAGEPCAEPPGRLFAAELARGGLRDLLAPLTGVRALTPVARVRSRERAMRVLNDDAKTVVRLTVEEPALVGPGRRRTPLPPRVRLEPVRGYDKALRRVRGVLENGAGLRPAPFSLVDEARAAGGAPCAPPARVPLRPGQRADEAVAAVLHRMLEIVEANLPGTIADVDSEFLHDLRVAVRRTRSVQRRLAAVFPPEPLAHFRDEFRWLQRASGPARDLDVYVLEFDGFAAAHRQRLEPLRGLLAAHRRAAHRRMVRALRSARAARLLSEWRAFLDDLPAAAADSDRPDAARRVDAVAGAEIRSVHARMLRAGAAIGDASPPEPLHDLRKRGKELRYLLELFGGLYPGRVAGEMVRSLKSLQDALGRFQDRQVQAATLRSLGDEVAALDGGADALMAMGLLVERLEEEQAAARAEFAERFEAFAAHPGRALVRETFA